MTSIKGLISLLALVTVSVAVQLLDLSATQAASTTRIGLSSPLKLAIDSRGYIYVVEVLANRVDRLAPTGRKVMQWGRQGSTPGQFSKPTSIAVDSHGHVYVMDGDNNRIEEFTNTGRFLRQWGSPGSGRGQFFGMFSGIAVDGAGHVYVADFTNSRVEIFTSTGKFLKQWGHYGARFGELDSPIDIAVHDGHIYVVDHRNNRVQEFSPGGKPIFEWSGLNQPEGLAVDPSGNVYVAADTILKLSPHGRRIASWGRRGGTGPGFFSDSGLGLALDARGYLYVADGQNADIQKLSPSGQVVALWR